ncbi:MAG TPA: hypothetical protein VFY15_02305 [Acidimicrobiia bacterium]|nr:hypothetical protein [Acidimicrobiia bacterium]
MRFNRLIQVLVVALVVTACGDDSGGLPLESTTTVIATTTTAGTTTTAAPTTTAEPTTTTAAPTTTTVPALPPIEFRPDGIGFADFGDDAAAVIGNAIGLFGEPSSDSGWLAGGFGDYGVCPGDFFRQVYFLGDSLMLMFSDVDYFAPGGVDNFIHYSYSGATPITAGPPVSIDVGTTVSQATAIWPGATVEGGDPLYGDVFYFDPGPGFEYLFATLTGTGASDTIEYVSGGVGCGE